MLYTTHRNHRVRKGHFLSVCSVFYLQSLLERCLSLSQTIQVPKTAWCEPQHHNFWFRGAAGKTKIPWRCFEQACAVHEPCSKGCSSSRNLSTPGMAQLWILAGRETVLLGDSSGVSAGRTLRAGLATPDTKGYWLATASIFSGVLYFFLSSLWGKLRFPKGNSVRASPVPCLY